MKFKWTEGFKQFILKTVVFLALFVIISFIIGQKIVASPLLYDFSLYIYGGMGKILVFCIVGFVLMYRHKLRKLLPTTRTIGDNFLVLLSLVWVVLFYYLELNIEGIRLSFFNSALIHVLFLGIFVCLLLGIYGLEFLDRFLKKFKKELLYFLIFAVVTYSLMYQVWKLWPYLSWLVLRISVFLTHIVTADVAMLTDNTLRVKSFAAEIGEACSGVYSIFIFAALYILILFLDWNKVNKKRAAALFVPAVIGAFLVNVLRVFLLFVVGGFVSRTVALGLYHSYVGMVFFLIYFAVFWIFAYRWMQKQKEDNFSIWSRIGQGYDKFKRVLKDPLYKNSVYLMASTLVMALLGFVFWIINARLFTTEQVGLATTIISVMGIITNFSLLGLNVGLIRYLGKSKRKNAKINTCISVVVLVTVVITAVFLLGLSEFSPKLMFIKENLFLSLIFILFMIFSSLNSLIQSIFIAYRSAKYAFLKNSIFSALKVLFPVFFVSLGAYGIFSSWMIAMVAGVMVSFVVLYRRFNYKFRFVFYDKIIRRVGKYSFGNYLVGFIGGLPILLLPVIITNKLSPEIAAFYYIPMMIATFLFTIPASVASSLFAEGSYNEIKLKKQVKKSAKIIALLLIPAIIITVLIGKYVLLFFGQQYSTEGFRFLQILALSGVFMAVNYVLGTVFKVQKRIKELFVATTIGTLAILILSYLFIGRGLLGVGGAWIIGQALSTLGYFILRKR